MLKLTFLDFSEISVSLAIAVYIIRGRDITIRVKITKTVFQYRVKYNSNVESYYVEIMTIHIVGN